MAGGRKRRCSDAVRNAMSSTQGEDECYEGKWGKSLFVAFDLPFLASVLGLLLPHAEVRMCYMKCAMMR